MGVSINGEVVHAEYAIEVPSSFVTATAAAATLVTATIPAVAGKTHTLRAILASCTGADTGAVTLTIKDGETTKAVINTKLVADTEKVIDLPGAGFAATKGAALTVELSAGAASSVGRLNLGYITL